MEDKGASKCWDFFKNALLEAQNQFMPSKGKVRELGRARDPPGLTASFWICSKPKEKCTRDGKADKHPLRTTRALPGHAEI